MNTAGRRWPLVVATALIGLLIVGFAAFQLAVRGLKGQVESALGPDGEVREIGVTLTGLEILDLRIRAPRDAANKLRWPAEEQLHAKRVLIVPSLSDLLSSQLVIKSIRVEGAYVSMLRSKDGKMRVLPGVVQPAPAEPDTPHSPGKLPSIRIGQIELSNATIEFFDATLGRALVKQRLEQINARIDSLKLPDLHGQSTIHLDGVLKGIRRDGTVSMDGSIELATKDSQIRSKLKGVDLVALRPYLLKSSDTAVRKGTLDLDLDSSVRQGRLHAPGTLSLSNLELVSNTGTLMGLPSQAALALMKNQNGIISVKFVLDGNINDPRFSFNENLSTRLAHSVASGLGVSVEGLAKGVGSLGSGAARGIGASLGKLFGE